MPSNTAQPVIDLPGTEAESAVIERTTPWHIRVLEVALILYALPTSVLYVYGTLIQRRGFSADWDSGWTWFYHLMHSAGALGILGYILYGNWRSSSPVSAAPGDGPSLRQMAPCRRGFEMALVLWIAFGFAIFQSIYLLIGGLTIADLSRAVSWSGELFGIVSQAGALGLLAYVLYRNSLRFSDLGLRWTARDAAMFLPLMIATFVVYSLFRPFIFWGSQAVAGHAVAWPDLGPHLIGNKVLMLSVLGQIVNGFFEELIVRAYLMTEIKRFTRGNWPAICISVSIQISYHFYQGAPLALSHIGTFLVLAWYYSKTNRILPVILAHISIDLVSLISYATRLDALL